MLGKENGMTELKFSPSPLQPLSNQVSRHHKHHGHVWIHRVFNLDSVGAVEASVHRNKGRECYVL